MRSTEYMVIGNDSQRHKMALADQDNICKESSQIPSTVVNMASMEGYKTGTFQHLRQEEDIPTSKENTLV